MATVGSILVDLQTNSAGFTTGIKSASNELETFKKQHGGKEEGGGILGNLLGGFAEGAGIGTAIEGLKVLQEAAEKVVEVGVEVAKTLAEWVVESTQLLSANNRLAATLGISTNALQVLQADAMATGHVGAEEFAGSIQKMEKAIGEAALGASGASQHFQALGLNVKDLANMPADQAFGEIAEAIKRIDNPAEQTAATLEIFGRSAGGLVNTMRAGKDGIAEARAEAERFGTAISDIDNAKVAANGEAWLKVSENFEGMKNQLAVALAPELTALAENILAVIPPADELKQDFIIAVHLMADAIGWVGDQIYGAIAALEAMSLAGSYMADKVVSGFEAVANAAVALLNMLPGVSVQIPQAFQEAANSVHKTYADAVSRLAKLANTRLPSDVMESWINDAEMKSINSAGKMAAANKHAGQALAEGFAEAAKKVETLLADLQKEAATTGMSEADKKLYDLKQAGASTDQMRFAAMAVSVIDFERATDEANKTLKDLNKELATMGMSEADKKLFDLQSLGLDEATMNNLRAKVAEVDKATAHLKGDNIIKDLQKEMATFGMDEGQKKVFDAERLGLGPDQIANIKRMTEGLAEMEKHKKNLEEGKSLAEQVATPAEKFAMQVEKYKQLLADKAISEQTYAEAVIRAQDEMQNHLDKEDDKKVAAITRRHDFYVPNMNKNNHADTAKSQLKVAEDTYRSQKQIEFYQQQQYNFARDAQNSNNVVSISGI